MRWAVLVALLLLAGCGGDRVSGPTIYCENKAGDTVIVVRCPDRP
jgi:hypothetical protein